MDRYRRHAIADKRARKVSRSNRSVYSLTMCSTGTRIKCRAPISASNSKSARGPSRCSRTTRRANRKSAKSSVADCCNSGRELAAIVILEFALAPARWLREKPAGPFLLFVGGALTRRAPNQRNSANQLFGGPGNFAGGSVRRAHRGRAAGVAGVTSLARFLLPGGRPRRRG
jgi:hypothetical protein